LEDVKIAVIARIRFALAAAMLAVVYYYLLVYLVGWMSAQQRPGWWLDIFPTRRVGILGWLIALHTFAVLLAALPVAVAAVVIARRQAVLLGTTAAVITTAVAVAPSFNSAIWPLLWTSHPIFFVTDQAKIIFAVPFIAWVLRTAFSNDRWERTRTPDSISQGGGR
jgi:hypothetical protein